MKPKAPARSNQDRSRPIRVLHSMAAPGTETRYSSHMAAVASDDIHLRFFTWRTALIGRYDIFHLHWPESFVTRGGGVRAMLSRALTGMLLTRLRLTRTPIVRTLHNLRPHDCDGDVASEKVINAFERMTAHEIHLVPEPDRDVDIPTTYVPHGSYREPFASLPHSDRVPGRILFFGLVKPYKGVDTLIEQFRLLPEEDTSLRITGRPMNEDLAQLVKESASADSRISHKLAFVPDADLVSEITSAELTVLPYRELHSSGAALVSLSLDTPILVPSTTTTRALREEVGEGWVQLFAPPLRADDLQNALATARLLADTNPPNLSERTWEQVRNAHRSIYYDVTS